MSIFTPTSRYWNWVLTSGLIHTPPMPGWNEPVATGTLSPIFNDAFWPSTARICGFWINRVLLSENSAVMVAGVIVTWKSVAFRLAREFRLIDALELVVVLFEPVVVLVLPLLL